MNVRTMLAHVALACALTCTLGSAASFADGWQRIRAPFTPSFPRDHGAHLDVRTEWWYATGIAQEQGSDRRFGWQITIFRQGLDPSAPAPDEPALAPHHLLAGHLAVVDMATHELVHAERLRRIVPGLADVSQADLDARIDGWSMRRAPDADGADETIAVRGSDRDAGIGLDLALRPRKSVVMHGVRGVSQKGADPLDASAYASWTRLETSGTLTVHGAPVQVAGTAWFDHEWGTSQLGAGVVGWDWFGLHLGDGRDLMVYRLRRADGSATAQSAGTLIERDGTARHLTSAELHVVPLDTWTSPRTQAEYPAHWHVEVRSAGIDLQLVSDVRDCEIDARASTGNVYWEGPVHAIGSPGASGYGELTGYAGSMEARF